MNNRPGSPGDENPPLRPPGSAPWGEGQYDENAARVEHRLQTLERSEGRMFATLRYVLVLLIAFAAYSWWSARASRANQDSEKEALKQRVDQLEAKVAESEEKLSKLSDAGDKRLAVLRDRSDAAFGSLSNRLNILQAGNESNLVQFATLLSNNWVHLNAGLERGLMLEVGWKVATSVSNATAGLSARQDAAAGEEKAARDAVVADVGKVTSKTLGTALMTQGQFLFGKTESRAEGIHAAACSYANAAYLFLRAGDESNARRCLSALCEDCVPALVAKVSSKDFRKLEAQDSIRASFALLIPELEKAGPDASALEQAKSALQQINQRFENSPVRSDQP